MSAPHDEVSGAGQAVGSAPAREPETTSFYGADLAAIHSRGFGQLARQAAGKLLQELGRTGLRGGVVLDLGCGGGELAGELHGSGFEVLGIDRSAAQVELAARRFPGCRFEVGSWRDLALPERCVAITAIGEVLSYVERPEADGSRDRTRFYRHAHRSLVPGGILLFDLPGSERVPQRGEARAWAAGGDWAVLARSVRVGNGALLERTITTFVAEGELYRRGAEIHRLELIESAAVVAELERAGFAVRTLVGYGAEPFSPGLNGYLARKSLAG